MPVPGIFENRVYPLYSCKNHLSSVNFSSWENPSSLHRKGGANICVRRVVGESPRTVTPFPLQPLRTCRKRSQVAYYWRYFALFPRGTLAIPPLEKFVLDVFVKFYQFICRGDLKLPPPTPQRPAEDITTLRGRQFLFRDRTIFTAPRGRYFGTELEGNFASAGSRGQRKI